MEKKQINIFTKITKRALQIGLTPFDIEFKKEPHNGVKIIELTKDKKKELQELRNYISGLEIENLAKEYNTKPKIVINQIFYD